VTVRQQWLAVLAVVALLGGGLLAAVHFLGDELFPVKVGTEAPDFTAKALTAAGVPNAEKALASYRGQVVLLNIWATWCGPCRVEMPSIEALHRDFGPKGLRVVAVSVDDAGHERRITDFAKEYGLTFELWHDAAGGVQKRYQTTGVPETFLIGRDGTIRKKEIGAANWNSPSRRAVVEALLAEPAP
jgi:cytochrome c biogenesis protein CcmG, thiol:disulfide interchange protein DsbE